MSGLDDYGARFYDPIAGQFTSADTTLAGGLNRYAYAAGNPETFVDPTGHAIGNPYAGVSQGLLVEGDPIDPELLTSVSLKDVLIGIGGALATIAAGAGWLGPQLHSTATQSAPAPVAARHQSNAMAAGTASVSATNIGGWIAHGVLPGASSAGSGTGAGSGGSGGSGGSSGAAVVKRLPPPTENGQAIGLGAPILSDEVLAECDPQLPAAQMCIGWTRGQGAFVPGSKWINSEHALTNGTYKVNATLMAPHLSGSQSGRSLFSPNIDPEVAVLDAAQFADENGLWGILKPNRAVVRMSGIVGTLDTGQDTQWIAVARRKSGWIHGWPEEAPGE